MKAATNLRETLESLSDDPASHEIIMAEGYGRALGLLEGIYLYCPDGRRFMESVLGTSLEISSEYADLDRDEIDHVGHALYGHSVKAS